MISKERAIKQFLDNVNDHLSKDSKITIDVGYLKANDCFIVTFDANNELVTYNSQFDSDRIFNLMVLSDFVIECEIFIEEIRVEIGCAIVCSYK
tara:strand:+ start:1993 stop:2274 length:282 start_codon:yes stop_codon:yes gene_type:complete